jgi:thiol-disulfide isomerase/thioredoxin
VKAKMVGRRKRISTFLGVAVVAVVVLSACSSAVPSNTDTTLPVAASTDSQAAPDFQITLYHGEEIVGGQEVSFSGLLGQGKPIVLNLWAGLCPPCRLEMPDLQAVSDEYADEILLFGLDVGPFTNLGDSEDGQALIQDMGITYPTGTTSEPEVVREIGLLGMPTTYFITPDGEIVHQWTGLLTEGKLTELVESLLEASGSS